MTDTVRLILDAQRNVKLEPQPGTLLYVQLKENLRNPEDGET